jgi:hypothetical protein
VLIALAYHAGDDGLCWPGQSTLAMETNLSLRAVRGAIAALRAMGLISCTERRREGGSRRSDHIVLNIGAQPKRHDVPVAVQQQARRAKQEARRAGHELTGNLKEEEEREAAPITVHPPVEIEVVAGVGVIETEDGYRTAAPVHPLRDIRTMLDTEGVAIVQELTGRSSRMARAFINRCLYMAYDEANIVLALLREAKSRNETDPSMWVEDQLRVRNLKTREPVVLPGGGGNFYREQPVSGMTSNLIDLAEKIAADPSRGDFAHVPGSDPDEILLLDDGEECEPDGHPGEVRGIAYASGGGSGPTEVVCCEEDGLTGESRDHDGTTNRTSYPENAFELFWHLYPERIGTLSARKAFDAVKISGQVAFRPLMEGLVRYKATKPKHRAWCSPTKWLEEGRWSDRLAPGQEDQVRRSANGFSELAARKVSGDDSVYRDPYQHLDRPGFGRTG